MDFHAKKFERKFGYSNDPNDLQTSRQFKSVEKSIYPMADCVVTVTKNEAEDILKAIPNSAPIAVVSNIHSVLDKPLPPNARDHICFLGNFNVNHNIDAAHYFIFEVFPLIRREHPDIEFHLIGFGSDRLSEFVNHKGVKLVGPVNDLNITLNRYRVFACPLTYGSGLKGKIGMAMSNGLPIVSSPIGVEGFPVVDGRDCFIADEPTIFAEKCIDLMHNEAIWNRFQEACQQLISKFFSRSLLPSLLRKVLVVDHLDSPGEADFNLHSSDPNTDTNLDESDILQRQQNDWYTKKKSYNRIQSSSCDTKSKLDNVFSLPTVSVVIPTYNRSNFLRESINSAIEQSRPADEIIIIDDASTDDTKNVVQSYSSDNIRYIFKNHSGAPDTRNQGIDEARGDYILWLDDDDTLEPNAIESHLEIIKSQPSVDVIYGKLQYFDDRTGNFLKIFDPKDWHANSSMLISTLIKGSCIPNPATMIKKCAYEKIGRYDLNFKRAHDYEFWTRAASSLIFKKNDNIICRYRLHSNNMSYGNKIDFSYESLIVRNLVQRYGHKTIFHWLDWKKPTEANAVSRYFIAKSLYSFGDYFNCYNILSQIPQDLWSEDIIKLVFHCYLFLGDSVGLNGDLFATNAQLKIISTNFKKLSENLKKAIEKQKVDKVRQVLVEFRRNNLSPSAEHLLNTGILFHQFGAQADAKNILKQVQLINPYVFNQNSHILNPYNSDDKDEICSTGKRILYSHSNPQKEILSKCQPKAIIESGNKSSLANAEFHYEFENYQASIDALNLIIASEPNNWDAYSLLMDVLLQSGNETAISEYFHPLERRTNLPADMLALLGTGYEASGDLEKAAAFCEKALSVGSDCARAWNLKGVIAYRNSYGSEAAQYFLKASECDENWGDPWTNMGTFHWGLRAHEKALQCFETGFKLSPTSPNVATTYHIAVLETGQYEKARELFEKIVFRHPHFRKGRFLLIDILIRLEAYRAALDQIEIVVARFGLDLQLLKAAKVVCAKIGPITIRKGKRPSLSLCMIVKNEAQNLPRCLENLKPLVDEMIVVDTGSNDATRDIAEIFGAKVFDFKWNEDFAAARNHSLDQASGDWILVMDADEIIAPKDHKEIKNLIKKSRKRKIAYTITTRNYTRKYNSIDWKPNDGTYGDQETGCGWIPSTKTRLFRNTAQIRFEYPVHELVDPALNRHGYQIKHCKVPVHHYGILEKSNANQKGRYYYKIGKRKLKQMKNDPNALHELAVGANILGDHQEAIKLWKRAAEIQPNNVRTFINLAAAYGKLGDYEKAKSSALTAVKISPHSKQGHYNLGRSEFFLGNFLEAKRIFEKIVRNDQTYYSANFMLGATQICCGNHKEGLESFLKFKSLIIWDSLPHAFQELAQALCQAGFPLQANELVLFSSNLEANTTQAAKSSLAEGDEYDRLKRRTNNKFSMAS